MGMSDERHSLEIQLHALGHILDRRQGAVKEICVLQAGDGFVVHLLEETEGQHDSGYAPTTVVIEAAELRAAIADLETATKKPSGWWRR